MVYKMTRQNKYQAVYKKRRKQKNRIWFEHNQDAEGYKAGDNRIIEGTPNQRREVVRRQYNF